jgi:hypothetical protein
VRSAGLIITRLGAIYGWATPEYCLWTLTLPQALMYYYEGIDFLSWKSVLPDILRGKAMQQIQENERQPKTADRPGIYRMFGKKMTIKRVH